MANVLGVIRGTVKLNPCTNAWKTEFQKTKREIESILKQWDLQIEHIGSTSIETLLSKPLLDVGVGVGPDDNILEMVKLLAEHGGYVDHGDRKERGGYLMVKFLEAGVISHHIHILDRRDQQWKNYLYFRDALRSDPQLRLAYQQLKIDLAAKYFNDRGKYTEGKRVFIRRVLLSVDTHG